VVVVPDPPDAAPSRFGADWTRRWTITAEVHTATGDRWRRDYPVLVFPSSSGVAMASGALLPLPDDDGLRPDDATLDAGHIVPP
jgi:hypothetical protein